MKDESKTDKTAISDPQSNVNVAIRYIGYLNPLNFRKRGTRGKALFALSLVCFFWGTTWIASKEAVRNMPALQMAGIRQAIGGICYISFFLYKGTTWPKKGEWNAILLLSFLNFVLSNGLSTWGVKYISAGLGSIIGAIFPLWILIIGLIGKKTKLQPKIALGLIMGFLGICVIFYEHLHDLLDPKFRFGLMLSLISTWSWAFGTIYTKKHAVHFNPYFALGLQMFISGIALNIFSVASGNAISFSSIPTISWLSIAYLVIFGSIISFIAYLYALQNLPTEQVSIYAYINPVVAVILGSLIFNEMLTPLIGIGVLITLYGVFLVNRAVQRSLAAAPVDKPYISEHP